MAGRKWIDTEIQFIKDNFGKLNLDTMANQLDRTERSVEHICNNLGLRKKHVEIGDVFGKLTVKNKWFEKRGNQQATKCLCECTCGNTSRTWAGSLMNGTISCGCVKSQKASERMKKMSTTHGLSNNRLYKIWNGIKNRCYRSKDINFHNYGAKGITVCEEWKDDFLSFYNWSMSNGYEDNLSIDRIDGKLGYFPENCRWVNSEKQNNNRNNNHSITAWGENKNLAQWARDPRCKTKIHNILYRIRQGYSPEDAISIPPFNSYRKKVI